MVKYVQSYTIDGKIIDYIKEKHEKTNISKSEIANRLMKKGLQYPSDTEKIIQIEKDILELKDIITKVFNIQD